MFIILLLFYLTHLILSSSQNLASNSTNVKQYFCCEGGNIDCIPLEWVCDNVKDCINGRDESICKHSNRCLEHEYMCKNGQCLPSFYKCNGLVDCSDGSDELACLDAQKIQHRSKIHTPKPPVETLHNLLVKSQSYPPKKTTMVLCLAPNYFKCEKSNKCIPIQAFCDGNVDCDFMEDETDCEEHVTLPELKEIIGIESQTCDSTEFSCNDGSCISKTKLCDKSHDCPADEDEGSLCNIINFKPKLRKPKILTGEESEEVETPISTPITNLTRPSYLAKLEKIFEQRTRVLIQGIPEASQSLVPSERLEHDLKAAMKILDNLSLEVAPLAVRRVGNYRFESNKNDVAANSSEWSLHFELWEAPKKVYYTFQPNQTMRVINYYWNDCNSSITFTSTPLQTFELYVQSQYDIDSSGKFFLYESDSLKNLNSIIASNYNPYSTSSGSFTIACIGLNSSIDSVPFLIAIRIKEAYTNPCQTSQTNGYGYGDNGFDFYETNLPATNFSLINTKNEVCTYSAFVQSNAVIDYQTYEFRVSGLIVMVTDYTGPSSVILSSYYEKDTTLFDFNEQQVKNLGSFYVFGELINFFVPPGGNLTLNIYPKLISPNITLSFGNYIQNFAMSLVYPMNFYTWPMRYNILCVNGFAEYDLSIIEATIPEYVLLNFYSGTKLIQSIANDIVSDKTIKLNGTFIALEVVFSKEADFISTTANPNSILSIWPNSSFLIRFDGRLVNATSPKKNIGLIIGLTVGGCVLVILLILILAWRLLRKKEKHFEQLYDILREMSLNPDEIAKMKQKSDQLLIENNKLHINFDQQLGQGSFATVYKGRLIGPSPLHLIIKSMETQKFVDCDVAVKVATNLGHAEVDQLFKEIEAMKLIEYHENVMCMLGWTMPDDKPCLVYDIANMDLLKFVREFREKDEEEVPIKIFVSVLWQVARGMQYISSKNMVHRDLAARNILICDSYTAKISDFGLCCTTNESFTYQAAGRSKKLPIKWLSIEALVDRVFSEKSDVWAFGVTMYEVFSLGKVPYATMNNDDVLEFLQENKRLEKPDYATEEMYEIMKDCWRKDVKERPDFGVLVERLYEILEMLSDEYAFVC